MAKQLSQEEKLALEELQATQLELQKTLQKVDYNQSQMNSAIETEYSFDRRGNRLYKNSEIHQNYKNAVWGTKWLKLPYCETCIFSKIGFWSLAAPFVGITFAMFKQARRSTDKMGFKNVMRYSLLALGVGTAYTFIQNLYYNDYCDINSYHYEINSNRASMANRVKGTFKKT